MDQDSLDADAIERYARQIEPDRHWQDQLREALLGEDGPARAERPPDHPGEEAPEHD